MTPVGLLAGAGRFPFAFVEKARATGTPVICVGIKGMADPALAPLCTEFHWLRRFSFSFIIRSMKNGGAVRWTMAGKFYKHLLFKPWMWFRLLPDWQAARFWFNRARRDNKDDTLLLGLIEEFRQYGLECVSALELCPELLVREGVLTRRHPTPAEEADIAFGWTLAREMGRLDIGQSVMVRKKAVLAIEAIEGTDLAIRRAGELCGRGAFVVVKVAKPTQDMRFDVPTVGPQTIESMKAAGAKTLAIEAGRTILIDEAETLALANRNGICITALSEPAVSAASALSDLRRFPYHGINRNSSGPAPPRHPMGLLKFYLPEPLPEGSASALEQLRFVAGYDRTPFPTTVRRDGAMLEVSHDLAESGYISTPWPVPNIGFPVTTSATLREKAEPYRLLTELARGKLNQIRNVAEDWKMAGLELPPELLTAMTEATNAFVPAVVDPSAIATDSDSANALMQAFAISEDLAKFFVSASAKIQQARIGRPATRCTCQISQPLSSDDAELYLGAFEVVQYTPRWAEIEPAPSKYDWSSADAVIDWATKQGRPVIVGPLIDLGSNSLPAWLNVSDGDVTTLAAYFCDFVETAVLRYRDRVRDWQLCTGFNHADLHNLTQDDRLRLVVRILEAARGADSEGRWVIGVNQPWGEYLDSAEHTLSPLVFCDTLMRSGLSIAGFNLEIIAGPSPRGSQLRDGLEQLRLFELYGLLGVPLDITASHPGRVMARPLDSLNTCFRASESADAQAEWGGFLATLSGTLSHVRCFIWNQWTDDESARGLIAQDGQAKPLLFRLRHQRAEFSA